MSKHLVLNNKKFLSSKAAAISVGYSSDYVGKLCREDKITCKKVGRAWFVEEASLNAFVLLQENEKRARKDLLSEERKKEYERVLLVRKKETAKKKVSKEVTNAGLVGSFAGLNTTKVKPREIFIEQPVTGTYFRRRLHEAAQSSASSLQRSPLIVGKPLLDLTQKALALTTAFVLVFGTVIGANAEYHDEMHAAALRGMTTVANTLDTTMATAKNVDDAFSSAVLAVDSLVRSPLQPTLAQHMSAQAGAADAATQVFSAVRNFFKSIQEGLSGGSLFVVDDSNAGVSVSVTEVAVQTPQIDVSVSEQSAEDFIYGSADTTTSSVAQTIINQPVIERIVETQTVVQQQGVSLAQLQQTENELRKEIANVSIANESLNPTTNFRAIALSQRIDQLSDVDISGSSITSSSVGATTLTVSGSSTFSGGVTFSNSPAFSEGITLASSTPSDTTNALYNVGGSLYFNGSAVGGGGGSIDGSGDTNRVAYFSDSDTLTSNAGFTFDGTTLTAGGFTTTGTTTLATTTASSLTLSGDLTVSGDDITLGTNTSGFILVADGTNFNPVAVSGDVTINASGTVSVADDALNFSELSDTLSVDANTTVDTTTNTLTVNGGLNLASTTPATTTNALYNVGGSLFFNGSVVAGGGGLAAADIDTSAELAAIVTDETGSGALVFAGSPTLTGTLGAASATFSGTLGVTGTTTLATTTATLITIGGDSINEFAGTGLTVTGNALTADLGTSVDISDETNLAVGNGITLTGDTLTVSAAGGLAQAAGGLTTTGVLEDLNTLGAAASDGEFIVATGAGAFAYESGATARASLGVDAAGTDNSTNVTLAGSLDYLTLSGQEITRGAIDLTADVTGTLPVGNGGTGATSLNNLITLGTHTTGNYLATLADSGGGIFTVSGSGSESAAVTLAVADDSLNFAQFSDTLSVDANTTVDTTTNTLTVNGGLNLASTTPATTTNALYNVGGSLFFNGSAVSGGGGGLSSGDIDTSAELAAIVTDETGSGALVFANSPAFTTPNLGTPSAATLTNATGLPLSSGVTGTLPVANGGTGATTLTDGGILFGSGTGAITASAVLANGELLIGDGTGDPTVATLSGGTNVSVSNGAGSITLNVDDAFLVNDADDTTTGTITAAGFTTTGTSTAATSSVSALAIGGSVITNFAGTGLTVTGNALTADLGTSVDISDETNLAVGNGITLTGDTLTVSAAGGLAQAAGGLTTTGVLEDLNTLGAAASDGEFIVATGAGAFAYESGATVRTSLGLGTGDSPTFTALTLSSLTGGFLKTNGSGVLATSTIDLTADVTGTLPVGNGGTGATSLNNLITLGTHTTGNYLATLADSGGGIFTVSGSGFESAAVTLAVADDSLNFAQFSDSLILDATTTIDLDTNSADLNFDGGTFYIDQSTNSIGIGDTTPDDLLNVHSASAAAGIAITSLGTDTDAYLGFQLADGTNTFTLGIDDSDGDKFKIGTSALGSSDRLIIDSAGDVGVGVSDPDIKLEVFETVAEAQLKLSYDATRYAQFQTDSVGDLVVDAQGGDVFLNDENLFVCTGGSCPAGTPASTGTIVAESRIGIGTSDPVSALEFVNNVQSGVDAYTDFQILLHDSGTATTSIGLGVETDTLIFNTDAEYDFYIDGAVTPEVNITNATSTFQGDLVIAGKLDVDTIDPVYTIDGIKYATFGHSTIGIKEEVVQTMRLTERNRRSGYYEHTISFSDLEEGSDLWLFYQITDFGDEWNSLGVTLTPSFDGRVFYEKGVKNNQLRIKATQSGEVSLRLIADRYDAAEWPNLRTDQGTGYPGHVIPGKR